MSKSKGIGTPTFLFFSDGIGAQKILFDREGSGRILRVSRVSSRYGPYMSIRIGEKMRESLEELRSFIASFYGSFLGDTVF